MSTRFGSTVMPGRTSCRPLTITRSPGFRPSVISRRPSCERPKPNGAGDHPVVLVHDVDHLLPLVRVQGAFGDEQGFVGDADGHPDAGEIAGGERLVLVGEDAPHPQGAGLGVDLVVDEMDGPAVGVPVLVGEAEPHGDFGVVGRFGLAFADQLLDAQHRVFVHVEVGVHRVHRHDRGEQGAAGQVARLNQVAHGDEVAADAAADGRGDLGEAQVQLGSFHGCLQGRMRRHRLAAVAGDLVELLPADRPVADQPACRARGLRRPLDLGLRRREVALGLLQDRPGRCAGRSRRARPPS